jgi:hypothetical protein
MKQNTKKQILSLIILLGLCATFILFIWFLSDLGFNPKHETCLKHRMSPLRTYNVYNAYCPVFPDDTTCYECVEWRDTRTGDLFGLDRQNDIVKDVVIVDTGATP